MVYLSVTSERDPKLSVRWSGNHAFETLIDGEVTGSFGHDPLDGRQHTLEAAIEIMTSEVERMDGTLKYRAEPPSMNN